MKIALVFEDMSQIWDEVLSWTVGADKIVLSLWEGRKQAPKIAFGKFVQVWDRIKSKLIFEGYVSKWDRDTVVIEKYWTFRDSFQATNPRGDAMIDGVITKQLVTHADERGFFREIIRATDEIFIDGFGQWSQSMMVTGTIKAWHIHWKQTDLFFMPIGAVKVVLCDLRPLEEVDADFFHGWKPLGCFTAKKEYEFDEYLLGDNYPAQVIRIPPGVAHGLKVLQGPAHLFYITSRVYDPEDEGRIPYDALGYNWFEVNIKLA